MPYLLAKGHCAFPIKECLFKYPHHYITIKGRIVNLLSAFFIFARVSATNLLFGCYPTALTLWVSNPLKAPTAMSNQKQIEKSIFFFPAGYKEELVLAESNCLLPSTVPPLTNTNRIFYLRRNLSHGFVTS